MSKLAELQRRKAETAAKIEQQRDELKKTVLEIKEEIQPDKLLRKAVSGAFGFSKNKSGVAGEMSGLPRPVSLILDVLVRDPKWALGLKLITPVVLEYWPKLTRVFKKPAVAVDPNAEAPKPVKAKIFAGLRKGISNLRGYIKKKEKAPETMTIESGTITPQPEN